MGRRCGRERLMSKLLPIEWLAALRFLNEGRLQTLFIVGGVAIGVGVIVFMSALLDACRPTSSAVY